MNRIAYQLSGIEMRRLTLSPFTPTQQIKTGSQSKKLGHTSSDRMTNTPRKWVGGTVVYNLEREVYEDPSTYLVPCRVDHQLQ